MTQRTDAPAVLTFADGRTATIRPLVEADRNALMVFGQSLPEDDWIYAEEDLRNPVIVNRLVNAFAAENWRQLVAVAPGNVIAAYSIVRRLPGWSSHVGDIRLIVHKNWRGVGLGSAMARAISDAARDLGVSKLIVDMLEAQKEGREVFARLGFQVEGHFSDHARDQHGQRHTLLTLAYYLEKPT